MMRGGPNSVDWVVKREEVGERPGLSPVETVRDGEGAGTRVALASLRPHLQHVQSVTTTLT